MNEGYLKKILDSNYNFNKSDLRILLCNNSHQLEWKQCDLARPFEIVMTVPVVAQIRRRSTSARLLESWVRIPPGAWMSVCWECYVLSDRGLCGELITCPEKSYRLWRVVVCDEETSWMRRPWPALGRSAMWKKNEGNMRWLKIFDWHKLK
jgi:hypothetical protein